MIVKPFSNLLKRGGFQWTVEVEEAFQHMKTTLTSTPVLALPNMQQLFIIEMDDSQTGIGVVLMQNQHPKAIISKTLSPKNQLLSIYDKELLAVVHAIDRWHHYLSVLPFTIRTDQNSLKHLLEKRLSTPSQFSWLAKIMGMNFQIQYKRGKENCATYALSRTTHGELLQMTVTRISTKLWDLIKKEREQDSALGSLIQQVQQYPEQHLKFKWQNGLLTRKGKLVIWSTLQMKAIILEWLHSSIQGGHSGVRTTVRRTKSLFYWKGMLRDIKAYIMKCEPYLRCKYKTVAQPGLIQPLPIPNSVWYNIAMDFIEELPRSRGKADLGHN